MTRGAVGRRLDAFQAYAVQISFYKVLRMHVPHRGHFIGRAQVQFGLPVAFQAPAHGQWLDLLHDFHLVDPAVARLAADAHVYVGRVAELRIVGQLMHLDPRNGFAGGEAFPDGE